MVSEVFPISVKHCCAVKYMYGKIPYTLQQYSCTGVQAKPNGKISMLGLEAV